MRCSHIYGGAGGWGGWGNCESNTISVQSIGIELGLIGTSLGNYLVVNNPSKIAFLQSLDYNDRVEETPVRGRNSIIQTPCLNNTYHDVTSVSRTLPRQGKKLLRDIRSRQNDSQNIQSEEESIY